MIADDFRRITGTGVAKLTGEELPKEAAGGKAHALSRMIGWDLPVPPSGLVTTDVFRKLAADVEVAALIDAIRAGSEVTANDIDDAFLRAPLDHGLHLAISKLALEVGSGRLVAIRSSATVEDLAGSSFAGQYRTVLDVDPAEPDAVMSAVRLVMASLWHPAPVAYRRALNVGDGEAAMAALVMQMVPAESAGVTFTCDPGSDSNHARIETVAGTGEKLVSGAVTPSVYVIRTSDPPEALPSDVAEALRLSLETEQRFGTPQDVEWAWDGSRLWLVQARPITAAVTSVGDGFDSAATEHELTTAGIGEMVPGVLPPLISQLNLHLLEEAMRRLLDDLGTPPEAFPTDPIVRRVRGRAALDYDMLRALAIRLPGGSADELDFQYFGSQRAGRPTAAASAEPGWRGRVRSALHDMRVLRARRWAAQSAEVVICAAEELVARMDSLSASTPELLAARARLIDLAARGLAAELSVAAVAASSFRRLELMLEPHLGAEQATGSAERVTSGHGVVVDRHPVASASVFAGPTFPEMNLDPPELPTGPGEDHRTQLLERLAGCSSWTSNMLNRMVRDKALSRLVDDTVMQLHRREAAKEAVLTIGGLVRRIHLELGRRLVHTGVLTDTAEVELLTDRELRDALVGQSLHIDLKRRARWLDRYGDEGPLPARFTGAPTRTIPDLPAGDQLEGWATSSGRVTGVAHVLRSPEGDLEPGSILVAEATDASWSPLFVHAAGIVLERGGPLSHAAILARELGIPAVLNVAGATHVLDGETVTVDGDTGIVVRRRR